MLSMYPACFFKEENGYSVIFPDLNFLATCGNTLPEAMDMAIDCLAGYLWDYKEDVPKASEIGDISLSDIANELDVPVPEGSFVSIISVDVKEYARKNFEVSVKKTLTIPKWMNEKATAMGINFSQVLQEALLERISQ